MKITSCDFKSGGSLFKATRRCNGTLWVSRFCADGFPLKSLSDTIELRDFLNQLIDAEVQK